MSSSAAASPRLNNWTTAWRPGGYSVASSTGSTVTARVCRWPPIPRPGLDQPRRIVFSTTICPQYEAFAAVGTAEVRVCRYTTPPARASDPVRSSSADTVNTSRSRPRSAASPQHRCSPVKSCGRSNPAPRCRGGSRQHSPPLRASRRRWSRSPSTPMELPNHPDSLGTSPASRGRASGSGKLLTGIVRVGRRPRSVAAGERGSGR